MAAQSGTFAEGGGRSLLDDTGVVLAAVDGRGLVGMAWRVGTVDILAVHVGAGERRAAGMGVPEHH